MNECSIIMQIGNRLILMKNKTESGRVALRVGDTMLQNGRWRLIQPCQESNRCRSNTFFIDIFNKEQPGGHKSLRGRGGAQPRSRTKTKL